MGSGLLISLVILVSKKCERALKCLHSPLASAVSGCIYPRKTVYSRGKQFVPVAVLCFDFMIFGSSVGLMFRDMTECMLRSLERLLLF